VLKILILTIKLLLGIILLICSIPSILIGAFIEFQKVGYLYGNTLIDKLGSFTNDKSVEMLKK